METDLTTQLTIEEKANLENLEGAIKRELGSLQFPQGRGQITAAGPQKK